MAKITKKQISEKDPFGELSKSAKIAKNEVKLLEQSIEMLAAVAKNIKGSLKGLTPNSSAGIKKINEQTARANTIAKEKERVQKRLNFANSQAARDIAITNEQTKIQNKLIREAAKDKLGLISVYQKESKRLVELRKRYKELVLTNKQNTAEGKRLLRNLTSLDKKLKRVDGTVGQFQRNVGNYTKAIGRMRAGLGRLAGALGVVGGFMLFRRVLTGSFNIVRDFGKATAELASVMNTTDENAQALEENAKKLGSTTAKTATEVVGLQLAYARLGFTTSEILDLTEATINGSIALNAELSETAELAGAMVNTFDEFSAADAPEILDKLTVSTQKSALNFEKLQKGLPIVGGAAEAAGIPFDRLLALMGKLSDAGIDASSSSTALRNIFIESAKQGLSYEQILNKIVKSKDKLTTSTDNFGKRSAVSASVLSKSIKATAELEGEIKNAAGAADKAAKVQLKTLDGAIKLLTSAWEGWILKMNDSSGAGAVLQKVIKFLANNLETILNIVGQLVLAFLAYKTTVIAVNAITKVQIFLAKAHRISQLGLARATKLVTKSFKSMNKAQKANVIGAIVAVVLLLVIAMKELFIETTKLEKVQHDLNEQLAREQVELDKVFVKINDVNTSTVERKKLIDQINELYGPYLENLLTEKSTIQEIAQAQNIANIVLEKNLAIKLRDEAVDAERIKIATAENDLRSETIRLMRAQGRTSKEIAQAESQLSRALELSALSKSKRARSNIDEIRAEGFALWDQAGRLISVAQKRFPELDGFFTSIRHDIGGVDGFAGIVSEATDNIELLGESFQFAIDKADQALLDSEGFSGRFNKGDDLPDSDDDEPEPLTPSASKEIATRLKELREELKLNKEKTEQLVTESTPANDRELIALKKISKEKKEQIKIIEDLLKLDKEKRDPQAQRRIELLNAEIKANKKLSIINIEGAIDEDGDGLRSRDLVDPNFVDAAKVARELRREKAEINIKHDKKDLEILEKKQREEARLTLTFNKKTIEEANKLRNKIIKNENVIKQVKFEAFQEENLKEQLDLENQFLADKVAGDFKTKEELLKAEKEFQKALNELKINALQNEQTLLDADSVKFKKLQTQIETLKLQNKDLDKTDTDESDKFELRRGAVDLYTQFFITQADKRIDKINQEIAAAQRQANILEGLAASGNITARESLAEQDQIIAEANLRKERLEKRKQNILLVSSILNAYNSALEAGDTPSEAFTSAITNTEVLTRFVQALPTFFDGIEDTGTHGQGVDGRGGFNAILHPNERVMTANQNAKMGGLSNEEVAGIIEQHRYGQFITVAPKMATEKGNVSLEREMVLVRKAIENQEVQNIELAEITQAAMVIRKTVKQGNRVTHSRFKVN